MPNYEKFDNQTIYYKSSEDMSELEDSKIDIIITSPPYNRKKLYADDLGNRYNDKKPVKEYFNFLTRVWEECYRVLSEKGIFFLNIGDAALDQGLSESVVQLAVNIGFYRLQTVIWLKSFLGKGHYTPTGGLRRLNNIWENIFILVKNKRKYKMNPIEIGIPYADKSNIGRYSRQDLRDAGNVWLIPYSKTTGATIKKGHEAPFPLELPYKCIKLSEGETVLDPFVGTGTTLAAARILGKTGYGYERFPRKDLIRNKILSSKFIEPPVTLLPHLELSVKILTQLNKDTDFNRLLDNGFFKFSKKERIDMIILRDVLNNLGITFPLINDYFNQINLDSLNAEKISEQISLSKFLLKNKKNS